jgi:ABC-type transporter Mla MlaB component
MSEEAAVVTITGSFEIAQIEEAHACLQETMASHRQVVLDLSSADNIDLAGLQLVCAMHRTALEAGVKFSLALPINSFLVDCAKLAGFASLVACHDRSDATCLWNETMADDRRGGSQ